MRWAASSSHHLPRLGLNRARRPYLTMHHALVDWQVDTLPNSAWHPQQPIDEPLHLRQLEEPSSLHSRYARVEADSARLCFPVIPTESSAANVRTFKRHNVVNLVLCRPLLHLPNLLVLVSARVVTPGVVTITCFAIENACAYVHTRSQIQIQWHSPTIMKHLEHRKACHFGKRCEYGGRVQQGSPACGED